MTEIDGPVEQGHVAPAAVGAAEVKPTGAAAGAAAERQRLNEEIADFASVHELTNTSEAGARCHYECLRWQAERGDSPGNLDLSDVLGNHEPFTIAEQIDYLWLLLHFNGRATSDIEDLANEFATHFWSANWRISENAVDKLSEEENITRLTHQYVMYFFPDHSAIVLPLIIDRHLPIVFTDTRPHGSIR